jgi:hypothetical protein
LEADSNATVWILSIGTGIAAFLAAYSSWSY